jgi:small-conductance mechanosensitive channel
MDSIWQSALTYLGNDQWLALLRATIKIILGVILGRLAARGVVRLFHQADAHQEMLVKRVVKYSILGVFFTSAIHELGFDIGVILGAAGILTVAIGFASQTSASNIISGIFLLGERPFTVGDVIKVGNTTGEVLAIDLLSVKLRTFDNLYVRIPNETLIKTELTNMRRFPIRRYDLEIGVAYKEDIRRVSEVLMEVADANPLCLEEPQPLLIFLGFGDSSIDYQFSIWAKTDNFLALRNSISVEIKEAFDRHGIEIPFPHRSLYVGSVTNPMPIRMMPGNDGAGVAEAANVAPPNLTGAPKDARPGVAAQTLDPLEPAQPATRLGGNLPGERDEV